MITKKNRIEIEKLKLRNSKMNIETTQNLRKQQKGAGRVGKGATMAIIVAQS